MKSCINVSLRVDWKIVHAVTMYRAIQSLIDSSWAPLPVWKERRLRQACSNLREVIGELKTFPDVSKIKRVFIRNFERTIAEMSIQITELSSQRVAYWVVSAPVIIAQRPIEDCAQ